MLMVKKRRGNRWTHVKQVTGHWDGWSKLVYNGNGVGLMNS